MEVRALVRNTIVAFASQGISLMSSFIMALIVPKALNISEYGYWQLFIFYSSYIGFCHLGLCDGVYLILGGVSRQQLDRRNITGQLIVCAAMQVIFAAIIIILSLLIPVEWERRVVIGLTAIYLVLNNVAIFLGYLFQAMNETQLFSCSIMLDRFLYLIFSIGCLLLGARTFIPFIVLTIMAKAVSLLYCFWNARDLVFVRPSPFAESVKNALGSISVGIKLMFANLASMLILGIARAFIDAEWGIETFGQVSFSLSLVNFFIAFVSQASMVLFPSLRQSGQEERRHFYIRMRDAMELLFPAIYVLYFPAAALLSSWLPQYSESIVYFALLLPICIFDSKMDICCTTYFKVARKEKVLLRINVCTVILSFMLTAIGVFIIKSIWIVLLCMVICILFRSFISEIYLNQMMKCPNYPTMYKEVLIACIFSCAALFLDTPLAVTVFTLSYLAFLITERDRFNETCESIRSMVKQLIQR